MLGCFPNNDEFSLGDRHAFGLQQQIAEILVPATSSKKGFDVAVDAFHHPEAYLGAAIVQDSVQAIQQHKRKVFERYQPLPAQLTDPALPVTL